MDEIEKKYEFTGETKEVDGVTVRRIRALSRVGWRRAGTVGGWIEGEHNLSQGDNRSWVGDEAVVMGRASVMENGRVSERAIVREACTIRSNGYVGGDAVLAGCVFVRDRGTVGDSAKVRGTVRIAGESYVGGDARLDGLLWLNGLCNIQGDAVINGNGVDGVTLHDAKIDGPAEITDAGHVLVLRGVTDDRVTVYRTPSLPGGHQVMAGCQVFDLNTDLPGLAEENDYWLTPHWEVLRDALKVVVAGW